MALQLWWVEPGPAGGLWLGRGLARAFQSLQAQLTHGGDGLKVGVEALQLHTPFAAEKPLGDLGAATCCRASSITKKLEDPAARKPQGLTALGGCNFPKYLYSVVISVLNIG